MINGIKLIAKSGFSQRNIIILSVMFTAGLGLAGAPDSAFAQMPKAIQYLFHDSVASVCVIGIIMNVIFPPEATDEPAVITVD
jgi:NCS2 family nucleobase:cation symporter-2